MTAPIPLLVFDEDEDDRFSGMHRNDGGVFYVVRGETVSRGEFRDWLRHEDEETQARMWPTFYRWYL